MVPLPAGPPPARGEALDERTQSLYQTLRDLAAGSLARERAGHTLQPTALVHEAWLRLARAGSEAWGDEAQFLAASARVLRQILVDHARRRSATKRGGDRLRVTLDELPAQPGAEALDLLALDEALERLAEQHPRAARVVELRFFRGPRRRRGRAAARRLAPHGRRRLELRPRLADPRPGHGRGRPLSSQDPTLTALGDEAGWRCAVLQLAELLEGFTEPPGG